MVTSDNYNGSNHIDDNSLDEVITSLSPIERKILPYLHFGDVDEISSKSGLDKTTVKRALQFLANKGIITLIIKEKKVVALGDNGVIYIKQELPERRLLNFLSKFKILSLAEAKEKSNLNNEEFSIALGILKKRNSIKIIENKINIIAGKEEISKKTQEEKFLELLPLEVEKLNQDQQQILKNLQSRKNILKIEDVKEISFKIDAIGKKLISNLDKIKTKHFIEEINPEVIKQGTWKSKQFRKYDLTTKAPTIFGGKRQPYYSFLQDVREKLVILGFEEMTGTTIVNEFWNFDALFQPQFHVAREWSATYYLKDKFKTEIPRGIISKVKAIHEKKWKTKWSLEKAQNQILRPQCTVLSALTLASKPKIPGKYFGIARCYRPDVIDAKHLTEFNQVEGIIIDKNLTLKNLFGILKLFAKEIANVDEIRIIPSYFPFTEPSAELWIKHPKLGWMEVGGAGIFRKEVVEPLLGENITVLAWGLGIDRLAMAKLGINDIRELFSQNLKFLRQS